MSSTTCRFIAMRCVFVSAAVFGVHVASADVPPPRQTWHLELRGIGGKADYRYPYSPVCFSPDSKLLAISLKNRPTGFERISKDPSPVCKDVPEGSGIGVWKTDTLEFVKWIATDARKVIRFTPDGKSIAALDETRLLQWNVESGDETAVTLIKKASSRQSLQHGFAWVFDDRIAVLQTGGIGLYSLDGKQMDVFATDKVVDVVTLESSADQQRITADFYYWNVKSGVRATEKNGRLVYTRLRPGTNEIWARAFQGNNGAITQWEPETNARQFPIREGLDTKQNAVNGSAQYQVDCLAFSPTGEVLASVGRDSCLHLWNAMNGSRIATLELTKAARAGTEDYGVGLPILKFVCFSPDGQWVLASSVESVSMFRISDLKPHIQAGKIHHVTQYFAGTDLVEETVTNPPGANNDIGTYLNLKEQMPGTQVAAPRAKDDTHWYDAVILAKTPALGREKGDYYNVHFVGYSRDDNETVGTWRIRTKVFPERKMRSFKEEK